MFPPKKTPKIITRPSISSNPISQLAAGGESPQLGGQQQHQLPHLLLHREGHRYQNGCHIENIFQRFKGAVYRLKDNFQMKLSRRNTERSQETEMVDFKTTQTN